MGKAVSGYEMQDTVIQAEQDYSHLVLFSKESMQEMKELYAALPASQKDITAKRMALQSLRMTMGLVSRFAEIDTPDESNPWARTVFTLYYNYGLSSDELTSEGFDKRILQFSLPEIMKLDMAIKAAIQETFVTE